MNEASDLRGSDMTPGVARRMNALNARFYQLQAASFSATRHAPWPGWQRCWEDVRACDAMQDRHAPNGRPLRILDLACGNLRFASYIAERVPGAAVEYQAVDSCPELVGSPDLPAGWTLHYHELDIISSLLDGSFETEARSWGREPYGLCACFGFLHHVPTRAARIELLRALLEVTHPGGMCCVSFWRFMSDERLAGRAHETTAAACSELGLAPRDLGPGDYLLGWQNVPGVWRYCHNFDDAEIDALIDAVSDLAEPADRFASDGRTGALNEYLVLQRGASSL